MEGKIKLKSIWIKYKKLIVILTIGILLAFLVNAHSRMNTLASTASTSRKEALIWRDKLNQSHAKVRVIEADRKTLKLTHESELQEMSKAVGTAQRNLRAFTTVSETISGDVEIIAEDTTINDIPQKHLRFDDEFMTIEGLYLDGVLDLKYQFTNEIKLITYKKWGKLYTEAISMNPNATITGLTKVNVTKETRIGVGAFTGYGLGSTGAGWVVGVGVYYRLFQL